MIQLSVFGVPMPLKRARAVRRGKFIQMYDPQVQEKSQVVWQVRGQYKEKPLACPIAIDLTFGMPIPKSTSTVRRRLMLQGEINHVFRPDLDNLIKFILDCLNGVLFHDDSQICEITAKKMYATRPSTLIRAVPLNETVMKKGKRERYESDSGEL